MHYRSAHAVHTVPQRAATGVRRETYNTHPHHTVPARSIRTHRTPPSRARVRARRKGGRCGIRHGRRGPVPAISNPYSTVHPHRAHARYIGGRCGRRGPVPAVSNPYSTVHPHRAPHARLRARLKRRRCGNGCGYRTPESGFPGGRDAAAAGAGGLPAGVANEWPRKTVWRKEARAAPRFRHLRARNAASGNRHTQELGAENQGFDQ